MAVVEHRGREVMGGAKSSAGNQWSAEGDRQTPSETKATECSCSTSSQLPASCADWW